jgi:hypothetical protein
MRTISWRQTAIAAGLAIVSAAASAQDAATPIIIPSQSSIYNQNSMNLPSPPVVHGDDTVRGAGGVSCTSAIAASGPYFDMGVIASQDVFSRSTTAVYGRVVVPLGERTKRLDCSRLYELEIARMQLEIDLLRSSAPAAAAEAAAPPAFLNEQPKPVGDVYSSFR